MYRSRLAEGLDERALKYVSSISEDAELVLYDILGSQAHVTMLHEHGLIQKSDARKILSALEELKGSEIDAGTGAEDIHEYVEAAVIARAGMESGGRMHTARSRNDQVALDIRMKIRDDINMLCNSIVDLIEALLAAARKHQRSIMPLYTHLQQAQVGTLSHYLLAQVDALLRDMDRLVEVYGRVNRSPLGAGPVGGTSIPLDRERVAKLLGFDGTVDNSIDATSSRDFAAEYVAALAILMTGLSRMAEDVVVWSSAEFAFVELPDRLASPSSIMPQKKNPDVLELTRAKASEVIGSLTAILVSAKSLATGYGRDLQQVKPLVWRSSETAIQATETVRLVVEGMTVNKKRMRRAADKGHLVALDVAEKLVVSGMPFRMAHMVAGLLVQKALERKKAIARLSAQEVRQAVRGTGVDTRAVFKAASSSSVVSSLRARRSAGSSGFTEQKRMLQERVEILKERRHTISERTGRITDALAEMAAVVKSLIE